MVFHTGQDFGPQALDGRFADAEIIDGGVAAEAGEILIRGELGRTGWHGDPLARLGVSVSMAWDAKQAGDLLSMLLAAQDEDGSRMTDKQLRDETITLFLAGHETTAGTLSWAWWLLAKNPAVLVLPQPPERGAEESGVLRVNVGQRPLDRHSLVKTPSFLLRLESRNARGGAAALQKWLGNAPDRHSLGGAANAVGRPAPPSTTR